MGHSIMFQRPTSLAQRILISLIVMASALLLANALYPIFGGQLHYFLLAAAICCALYGGYLVGVMAAVIAAIGYTYFFQHPRFTFTVQSRGDWLEAIVFLAVCTGMSWLGGKIRAAYFRAELARREAEEATRARDEILAIVSHDLKNPLNAIRLNCDFVLTQLDSEASCVKYVGRIRSASARMDRLIRDLLDFEKLKRGSIEITLTDERAGSLLDEAKENMKALAEDKSIRMVNEGPDIDALVLCDHDRVMQVFGNLLGNAIKFCAEGSSIVLGATAIGEEVIFSVADTGPGIEAEDLPHIFDRYWQGRKTSRQGTGLGLAISKAIIEGHHGRIWATSRIGAGTTVYFSLPSLPAKFASDQMIERQRPAALDK